MAGSVLPIRRVFTPDDMRPLLAPAGVQKTILVQTWSSHAESRAFLALAQATDFIAGLVTWVDLEAPDVAEKPDDFCAGPQGMWLVGIRHQVQHQADPRWLCRSEVRRGLRAVPAHELVYDRLIVPRELIAALETVRVMPGLPYVIDHIAKPEIAKDGFVRWTKLMRPFDAERQVWCQLPGW